MEKAFLQQNSDCWTSDEGRVAENAAAFGGRMGRRVTDRAPENLQDGKTRRIIPGGYGVPVVAESAFLHGEFT